MIFSTTANAHMGHVPRYTNFIQINELKYNFCRTREMSCGGKSIGLGFTVRMIAGSQIHTEGTRKRKCEGVVRR